jgi:predicted Zn-dependent peptidase
MKLRVLRFFLLLFLFVAFLPGGAHSQNDELLKHPRDMNFPPLSFQPPKPTRAVLSNGMVVYLLENPELPLIRISALIRTGSVYDPPDKSGLAKLTAAVMRTGGAEGRNPQEINATLENLAADIEFSMETEAGNGFLFARKQDFPQVLPIFFDLLTYPSFDPAQLDLAKKAELESIRRQNDSPEEIAYREFRRALYRGNPRGQIPTIESVEKMEREDLIVFHRRFFYPNNILLGVSGDFQKEEMIEALEKTFGSWTRSLVEMPFISVPSPQEEKSIYYAPKDLPTSTILVGHLSLPLNHPGYFPFKVLNFILGGGGFNSRLTQEIRSNQGLAYNVGSFFSGRVGYGVFGAVCQTKSSSTHKVISLLYEIIEGMKKNPPKTEEMEWAKNTLINQFIFSFASSAAIVGQQMRLEYDGLPEDYLEKYQERVAAVTSEDLQRAAQEHLHPGKSLLVVVGKEEDFERPLSSFGPVKPIELKTNSIKRDP